LPLPLHHPSDALLTSLASGSLDESEAMVTGAHVRLCPTCRRRVALLEAVGGSLLDDLPPTSLSDEAVRAVFARLDDPVRRIDEDPVASDDAPPELRALLPHARIGRRRRVAPGIRWAELRPADASGGAVRLFRMAPGTRVPAHGHDGGELTLILGGGIVDGDTRYGPGDLLELDDDVHAPEAALGGDCLCLVTTRRPLVFTSPLPRLMRPWTLM